MNVYSVILFIVEFFGWRNIEVCISKLWFFAFFWEGRGRSWSLWPLLRWSRVGKWSELFIKLLILQRWQHIKWTLFEFSRGKLSWLSISFPKERVEGRLLRDDFFLGASSLEIFIPLQLIFGERSGIHCSERSDWFSLGRCSIVEFKFLQLNIINIICYCHCYSRRGPCSRWRGRLRTLLPRIRRWLRIILFAMTIICPAITVITMFVCIVRVVFAEHKLFGEFKDFRFLKTPEMIGFRTSHTLRDGHGVAWNGTLGAIVNWTSEPLIFLIDEFEEGERFYTIRMVEFIAVCGGTFCQITCFWWSWISLSFHLILFLLNVIIIFIIWGHFFSSFRFLFVFHHNLRLNSLILFIKYGRRVERSLFLTNKAYSQIILAIFADVWCVHNFLESLLIIVFLCWCHSTIDSHPILINPSIFHSCLTFSVKVSTAVTLTEEGALCAITVVA